MAVHEQKIRGKAGCEGNITIHVGKGNCYDNSIMESFFGVMKNEMYYGLEDTHKSFAEFKKAFDECIAWYNKEEYVKGAGTNRPFFSGRNGTNHANQFNRLKRGKKVDTYQIDEIGRGGVKSIYSS